MTSSSRPPCRCYNPGDFTTAASTAVHPNPVIAELEPIGPPPKPPRAKAKKPKPPKPARAIALPQSTAGALSALPALSRIVSALQPAYIVCQRGRCLANCADGSE